VELYSIEGYKILNAENTDKIDIRNLAPGVYFLRMQIGRDVITEKIVKL
jgi:hypothetical protein